MPRPKNDRDDHSPLNPKLGNGLIALLLLVAAALSALSFFELAGVAGTFIDALLAYTFGATRYITPFILVAIAVSLLKKIEFEYKTKQIIGAFLFIFGLNAIIHLQKPLDDMYALARQGYGGGMVGFLVAWPGATYLGYWGSLVVLIGIFIAGVILLFNTSLATLVGLHKPFFLGMGWVGRHVLALVGNIKQTTVEKVRPIKERHVNEPSLDEEDEPDEDETDEEPAEESPAEESPAERSFKHKALVNENANDEPAPVKSEETISIKKPKVWNVKLPPVEMLHPQKGKPTSGDIKSGSETIKNTLQNFGIEADMGEVRVGPTVTQYSLKPAAGIKLTRITGLADNIALALAAHPIRIEAPIPGQSLVGIEVPNQKVAMVSLRELLESSEFKNRPHNMVVAVGKDVAGKVHFGDLPRMPHLLVAGTTGSGKTVCINTIILSLLYQNTPETLRFIMVDPKRVELTLYNGIPHLLTPVITDAIKTVNALKWTIGEMDRRFDVLAAAGKRDIASYNKTAEEKLPYIVFVIDELADLMAMAAAEVEAGIIRLAQMARAVGIHLVVATQRPSVEVITGLMKANIPARLAFSVASSIDSRTILDTPGAEKLLGRGDMLMLTSELSKPRRLQGAFVSEEELKDIVDYLRGDEPPEYDDTIVAKPGSGSGTLNLFGGPTDEVDPMFNEAKRVVLESGKASASLLQRRIKVGYARAARLLDELEEAGIVGPADGAKPREVFTEHIGGSGGIVRPAPEAELDEEEQTMDAGGTVLNDPDEESNEAETDEESNEETDTSSEASSDSEEAKEEE